MTPSFSKVRLGFKQRCKALDTLWPTKPTFYGLWKTHEGNSGARGFTPVYVCSLTNHSYMNPVATGLDILEEPPERFMI